MFFYITRNAGHDPCVADTYIHFNSCGWYENADLSVHTYRPNGLPDYQLIYIKKGSLHFKGYGICDAGTLYLYRPNEPQDYYVTTQDTDYYWAHFTGKAFAEMFSGITQNIYNIGYCESFIAFCREIVMQYADTLEENMFYIQGRLLSTVASLPPIRQPKAADALDNAITYINEYYPTKPTNDELAKLCGMSKFHFIRRFTQKTGKTPQKYRTDLLLSKSTTMLTDTDLKVSQIAAALGFDDSLYFSRLFKKSYGMSPLEYRKRH